MNKFFISAAIFFIGTIALAMPKVGDEATFNGTSTTNGATTPFVADLQLVAFDANTGMFTETMTVTANGTTQNQSQSVAAKNLISDALVATVLQNCAAYNGRPASLTVPAGTFDTCALPMSGTGISSGTVWVGAVSFGIVKEDAIETNGTEEILELVSQKVGQ